MRPVFSTRLALLLIAQGCCFALGPQAARAADPEGEARTSAAEIVKAVGIRPGPALCVHLDVTDGRLTAELARSGGWLVHGLAPDSQTAEKARKNVQATGVYGLACVEVGSAARLPYADNLVNVVVIDPESKWLERGLSLGETLRVVCPKGVAMIGGAGASLESVKARLSEAGLTDAEVTASGAWIKIVKPRPAGMDEWTHESYRAHGNTVSKDAEVRPVSGLRWLSGAPSWPSAGRQAKGSSMAALAAGGRFFQLVAPLPPATKAEEGVSLIARDAFSGLRLWRRSFQTVSGWYEADLMIAMNDKVYLAPNLKTGNVTAMSAATGETAFEFKGDSKVRAMVCEGDRLLVATEKKVCALDAADGKEVWNLDAAMPADLVVGDGQVYFLEKAKTPYDLVKLDLAGGKPQWRSPTDWGPWKPAKKDAESRGCPLYLRFYQNGVLVLGETLHNSSVPHRMIYAVSAQDGKHLWTYKAPAAAYRGGYTFFRDGLVWIERGEGRSETSMIWEGIDPRSGEVKKRIPNHPYLHQKCQLGVATERYSIDSRNLTLVEWESGKAGHFRGIRGGCGIGAVPANGLLYAGGLTACGCSPSFLRGAAALAPDTYSAAGATEEGKTKGDAAPPLEKGPAFGSSPQSPVSNLQSEWPTYRHDPERSGGAAETLSANLTPIWDAGVAVPRNSPLAREWSDDPVSSPVVAEGTVFVADTHAHQVVALDANAGKEKWRFTAGGRIDSPPTIHKGLCLFGSHDGWVYCLRAADGQLAWRLRAAPEERRISIFAQLESPWPVPGSILVSGNAAYFLAGRSSHSDGGLLFYAVEPATGKVLFRQRLDQGEGRKGGFSCLSDILVSDGPHIYLATTQYPYQFDAKTGTRRQSINYKTNPQPVYMEGSNHGMLDDAWLLYPLADRQGMATWKYRGVDGQLLVVHQDIVCGLRKGAGEGKPGKMSLVGKRLEPGKWYQKKAYNLPVEADWTIEIKDPMQMKALLLAGTTLAVGGTPDRKRLNGQEGILWLISAPDGRKIGEIKLPSPPSYDGLAAANGRLYVSTKDGKVLCFGDKPFAR